MNERELTTRELAETQDEERTSADAPSAREQSEVNDEANDPLAGPRNQPRSENGEPDAGSAAGARIEGAAEASSTDERGPLLPVEQSERFTERWQEIQAGFVDEPRESVAKADALVADLMQRLAASFSDEREGLEAQWDRGDDVSTEDLRVALTCYRSFFDRLLTA